MSPFTSPDAAAALSSLVAAPPESPSDTTVADWSSARWREVAEAALVHDLGPVLYHRLESAGLASDGACMARLRASYLRCLLDNARILEQFGAIAESLAARGIEVIALKGVHLAAELYPDPAHRPMRDIDLLVREAAVYPVQGVLRELGYRPFVGDGRWDPRMHHLPPYFREHSVSVEVHTHLVPPRGHFDIDAAGLWKRAVPLRRGSTAAAALCPEDLLLHLCLHAGAHHAFRLPLRALYDVHRVLTRAPGALSEETLVERAAEWKAKRAAYWCLVLTHSFFGTPLPERVLAGLETGGSDRCRVDVLRDCVLDPTNRLPRDLEMVMEAKGWRETLREARAYLRNPFHGKVPLQRKTFSTHSLDESPGRKQVLTELVLLSPRMRGRIARSRAISRFRLSRAD